MAGLMAKSKTARLGMVFAGAALNVACLFAGCSRNSGGAAADVPDPNPPKIYFVPNDRKEGISANPIQEYKPANRSGGKFEFTLDLNSEKRFQTIVGLGGAFNENGGEALAALPKADREQLLRTLFAYPEGAGFAYCRLPIGASDFALAAYSYSETPDDWEMKHFSLAHDETYLIPFVQAALKINPKLRIFASPWSPPGWMKRSGKVDGGGLDNVLRAEPEVYRAYALYFEKYVRGYADHGVNIERVMIQNEPDIDPVYPGCFMPSEQIVEFATQYLIPRFQAARLPTEVWGGTFREAERLQAHECMVDEHFAAQIRGLGVQYSRAGHLKDLAAHYPRTPLMHTEGICYDGANSPEEGQIRLPEILMYLNAGCETFMYWNMILNETGESGWNWKQNCLINIDRGTKAVTYNPDYAVMFLASHFIRPGAQRIEIKSDLEPIGAFRNVDGRVVILAQNTTDKPRQLRVILDGRPHRAELPAHADAVVELQPEK